MCIYFIFYNSLNLSVLGISKDFLFCDNVDTVCKGIVNTFKKKYH